MPLGKHGAGRGRRENSRRSFFRTIEALERRELLTLTPLPLAFFTSIPFAGPVATFAPGDVAGGLADFSATVTWGDGTSSTAGVVPDGSNFEVLASKTYASAGQFPLTITVNGLTGTKATAAEPVTVTQSQLAATSVPISTVAGVLFQGKVASFTDNTGSPATGFTASITWAPGVTTQGTITANASNGFDVTGAYTYTTAGPATASVTITRIADGKTATAVSPVTVAPTQLIVSPAAPISTPAGLPFSGKVATFTDNTGAPIGDFTATITWAPNVTTQGNITANTSGGYDVTGAYTYTTPGSNTVTVTVTRSFPVSQTASTSTSVTVTSAQLVVTSVPISAVAGVLFQGKVAAFTDNTGAPATGFTASITWTSGVTTQGTITANASNGFDVTGAYTYTTAGPATASVTITRIADGKTATAVSPVTVAPTQLIVSPAAPISTPAGLPFSGKVATFTDNTGAPIGDFTATITWAPNVTTQGNITANTSGGYDVTGAYTYTTPGSNTVTVTVTRSFPVSQTASTSTSVTVTSAQLVVTSVPISAVAGVLFQGKVAAFTDNTGAPATGFTASITWTSGVTTQGTITANASNGFDVTGAYTYTTAGPATASVTITRIADGKTATAVSPVTVAPTQLIVSPAAPISTPAGLPFSGKVATFTDNTGAPIGDFTATITWAPNVTTQGNITANTSGGYDVTGAYTYTTPGSNTVTVTVTRSFPVSQTASTSTSVTVTSVQFAASGNPINAVAGVQFNGMVATFTDNTSTTAAGFTATITWAPNVTTQGNITYDKSSGVYSVSGAYTYTTAGQSTATVAITRTADSKTVSASSAVTVMPAQLVVSQAMPITATAGVAFSGVVASFTDNTGALIGDFTATINWGQNLPTTQGTISGPNGKGPYNVTGAFTYTTPGPYTATVTVTRSFPVNQTATASTSVTVAPAPLVATGTTIHSVAGSPFSGVVASFTGNTNDTAAGFTATINWGTGLATTQGIITQHDPNVKGVFDVSGAFTYPAAGQFSVTVTITRLAFTQTATATTNAVVNGLLTTIPQQGLTATVNQPFFGTLATLVDSQSGSKASDFKALIDWGDGSPITAGSVVTVTPTSGGGTPFISLVGTHTYSQQNHYTITTTIIRIATGQKVTGQVGIGVYGFNGAIDPLSQPVVVNGVVITDQQEPIFSGQAEPQLTIRLWFRRIGGGDPFPLGETQADATGKWSLVIGPLAGQPIFIYGVSQPATGPPTATTLLNGGMPLYVVLHPVRALHAVFGPSGNQITVSVARTDSSGPDPSGLALASSYSLTGAGGLSVRPTSVRVAPMNPRHATAARSVTLTFSPSALPHRGSISLRVAFAGLASPGNAAAFILRRGRA